MLRSALLILLALPATAHAGWSAPEPVTGDVPLVAPPQVAFTQAGQRLVTSTADVRLLTYGTSRVLIVSGGDLRARFGAAGGTPGAAHRLAPGERVLRFSASANATGDAAVAYLRTTPGKRVVRVVRRRAGRAFSRPETIAGRGNPSSVAATVSPNGTLTVAYERGGRVEVRTRSPHASAWGAPQVLGAGAAGHTQLAASTSAGNHPAVAWFAQALTEGGSNGRALVRLSQRTGRRFHTPVTLEEFAERAPDGAGVRLAAGVLGWTGRAGGHFVARVVALDGGTVQTVSDPGADAVLGDVATGTDGTAVAVWAPPLDTPSPHVFAAVRAGRSGPFGAPETVSPAYREVAGPAVAVGPAGQVAAAWVARTGDRTQAVLAALRGGS